MSIEPYAIRFAIGTKVMPPKQHKPVPTPKLSMADEAKAVNARFKRKWGAYSQYPDGNDPNEARRIEAADRCENIEAVILAMLQQYGPLWSAA
jgi:hypothetical protein